MNHDKIRSAVRDAILVVLEEALKGDELIMKEIWEECADRETEDVAKDEIRAIKKLIEVRAECFAG